MIKDECQLRVGDLAMMRNRGPRFRIDLAAGGAAFGNAAAVRAVVEGSLMRDGEASYTASDGNREASFLAAVTASDRGGLSAGEAAIEERLEALEPLTWLVPDEPPCVFDPVRAWSEFLYDEMQEANRRRLFRLNFECLPYVRSAKLQTINWTGANTYLDLSTSGVTVISGGGTYVNATIDLPNGTDKSLAKSGGAGGGTIELTASAPLKRFLGFVHDVTANGVTISNVIIDGVAIADAASKVYSISASARQRIYDVSAWEGQTPTIRFTYAQTGGGPLHALYTTNYPNPIVDRDRPSAVVPAHLPGNLDVIDALGTARAVCTIRFTAPTGGAFVYTGPNPATAIRNRGLLELKFASFEVTDPNGISYAEGGTNIHFPEGPHHVAIARSAGQPPELHPNGIWPEFQTNSGASGIDAQWVYPSENLTAISFFNTSGAKTLISPSGLQKGYRSDAIAHSTHVLHPSGSGFGVMDQYGRAIAATIEWYPHWKHNAAL